MGWCWGMVGAVDSAYKAKEGLAGAVERLELYKGVEDLVGGLRRNRVTSISGVSSGLPTPKYSAENQTPSLSTTGSNGQVSVSSRPA